MKVRACWKSLSVIAAGLFIALFGITALAIVIISAIAQGFK